MGGASGAGGVAESSGTRVAHGAGQGASPADERPGRAEGETHSTPGAASALMGGFQFTFGAIASPLVGLFGEDSSLPMALIMLIALAGAGLSPAGPARPWRGDGEVTARSGR
ncbi:hypothetical protein C5F59_009770 [Streptomyces sp. QL37]|uniref:hypothetical protein n=1 Tax=Streptomyces sp. QL37 TaxID=2093747 RepID=UPI0021CB100B|nr:hypothetical protein [Streptomyces sp. QL37]